jgi:hypothetical protein
VPDLASVGNVVDVCYVRLEREDRVMSNGHHVTLTSVIEHWGSVYAISYSKERRAFRAFWRGSEIVVPLEADSSFELLELIRRDYLHRGLPGSNDTFCGLSDRMSV